MSDNIIKLPELDAERLNEAAKEAAMKGALECINEYYTGYKSPFKKAITEELEKQEGERGRCDA